MKNINKHKKIHFFILNISIVILMKNPFNIFIYSKTKTKRIFKKIIQY